MALRTRLQRGLVALWQRRGWAARVLYPLALVHSAWRAVDAWRYRSGLTRPQRLPRPVIVVGNLYVGGTGKTPLTIELVRALRDRGWHPGIISRGYGAGHRAPRMVDPHGTPAEYGDEPLLLATLTGAPVAVGRDRVAAGRFLLNLHPRTDVVIADDGLQHRRLARDVEIAVLHYRGLGNGWLLPAGPLRDPPQRLADVDAVVFNDQLDSPRPRVRLYSPFYGMRTTAGDIYALKDPARRVSPTELAAEQRRGQLRLIAACGIGMPERFFAMLRQAGLEFEELPLHDHYPFTDNPFGGRAYDCLLITEKDAVKCRANAVLAADGRICVVPLQAQVDAGLFDLIDDRLRIAAEGSPHGPPPA
jgi:tetraacyldisaccharide 4'-kinase